MDDKVTKKISCSNVFEINQAVHGYSGGHTLIESSLNFDSESNRTSLILSDISGISSLSSFDTYLSGYPLPNKKYYAFARTWRAEEKERPGCVWTHTLFIKQGDLLKVKNIFALLNYFKRPIEENAFSFYSKPFMYSENEFFESTAKNFYDPITINILSKLYRFPESPVFVSSENSLDLENTILSVWISQVEKFRFNFKFCSGSFSNRMLGNDSFDLQVIPISLERQIKREVKNGVFLERDINYLNRDNGIKGEGLDSEIIDLMLRKDQELSKFLLENSEDLIANRKTLACLLKIYGFLLSENKYVNVDNLIKFVAESFPEKSEATSLKKNIFGFEGKWSSHALGDFKEEVLYKLVSTEYYQAFDGKILKLSEWAKSLWLNNRDRAMKFILNLSEKNLTSLGRETLLDFTKLISVQDISALFENNPKILYILAGLNPMLVTTDTFWQGGRDLDKKRELVNAILYSNKNDENFLKKIIFSLLNEGIDSLADDFYNQLGARSVQIFLQWVTDAYQNNKNIDRLINWKRALSFEKSILLNWAIDKSEWSLRIISLIADVFTPDSIELKNVDIRRWLSILDNNNADAFRDDELLRINAFILSLGFNNWYPRSEKLVTGTFQIVHDALAENRLSYPGGWRFLENKVPDLGWLENWDRCKRLRRALVQNFIKYDWPVECFFRSLKNHTTLEATLKNIYPNDINKKFINEIIISLDSDNLTFAESHKLRFKRLLKEIKN